jgi:hypothetical protein
MANWASEMFFPGLVLDDQGVPIIRSVSLFNCDWIGRGFELALRMRIP